MSWNTLANITKTISQIWNATLLVFRVKESKSDSNVSHCESQWVTHEFTQKKDGSHISHTGVTVFCTFHVRFICIFKVMAD